MFLAWAPNQTPRWCRKKIGKHKELSGKVKLRGKWYLRKILKDVNMD